MRVAVVFLFLAVFGGGPILADPVELKPLQEWAGSIEDERLLEEVPIVVSNPNEFVKLWKAWKFAEEYPKVDFAKNVAVVQTTRGSKLGVTIKLDKASGVLHVKAMSSRDLRKGFRYHIATVPRAGIKSVEASQ